MLKQVRKQLEKGWKKGVGVSEAQAQAKADATGTAKRYSHSVIPGIAGGYYGDLRKEGIGLQTPVQLAGAVASRFLTDVGDDASRHLYWRYNHPMAIADKLAEQALGSKVYEYSGPQRAAIKLASIGVPVSASLGTFDITNLSELGRPKGFAQSYAEQGSEDRRQTGQVAPELIDRFVLGRQGRPLKFDTAREDIPDLTKQRYANYMNYLYNEKGPLGVGVIKGTMENLQGEPEVRIVGFPVGLQAAGALAGGAGAAGAALRTSKGLPKARNVVGLGAGGAVAGALAGKLMNRMIASTGQSDLPTTQEYGIT